MRQILVLGSLLLLSLVAAYLTWTGEEKDPKLADRVAVYRADESSLEKLTWKADDLTLDVEKRHDPQGDYLWVVATEQKKKKSPPQVAGDTDAPTPPAAEEMETKTTAFLGNDAADKLWKAFSPLMALRELDTSAGDQTVYGLEKPKATLEVKRSAGAFTLSVGGETWGAKDRYVGADSKVFLVDDADLKPLQFGKTRLVERNLQPLEEKDIERMTIRAGDKSVAFLQKNRADKAQAFWAREATPDAKDEVGGTWLDRVLKLRVHQYTSEAEVPANLDSVFTWSAAAGANAWEIEILKDASADPPEFYARSTYTRALTKLTRQQASEAVVDLASILEASSTPTPAPESP